MKTIYKVFAGIIGVLSAVAAFLFYKNKDLRSKEQLAETDKIDAVLEENQKHLEAQANTVKENLAKLEKTKPVAGDLNDKEIADYWNNNRTTKP